MVKLVLQEKLNCLRNEMTHLWGSVFVVSGGSIATILNKPNFFQCGLAIFGFILALCFLNAYFIRRTEILHVLEKLKEEK